MRIVLISNMDGKRPFPRTRPTAGPSYSSNDLCQFSHGNLSYGIKDNEWRILLIGKTGVGKSFTGNSILGTNIFTSKSSGKSVTQKSQMARADRFGKELLIVDTPGIFDTGKSNEEVLKEIVKCIGMTSPGLHAIILVVQIGRFTEEEKKTVDLFLDHLGEQLIEFLVIVFTRKDDIDRENTSIDEYVDSLDPSSMLSDIIKKIGRRYVAFDNTAGQQQNEVQVKRLFSVIENLIRGNEGKFYSNEMYKAAETALRHRMDEDRKRLEEEKRREIEKILAPYKAEIEKEKRKRESLSQTLAATREKTTLLAKDNRKMKAELEITKQRFERQAAEIESERRRMKEEGNKDREIYEQRLRKLEDESQRIKEECRREYVQRLQQIEHDRRREREEEARRIKEEQEEFQARLSEMHKRDIEKVQENCDRKFKDESQRIKEESRREYDQSQRQIEQDQRREREEEARRIKEEQEELQKRLSEKHKKEIETIQENCDQKMRDLRQSTRKAVQEEEPGFFGTFYKLVSKIPLIGPFIGKIKDLF